MTADHKSLIQKLEADTRALALPKGRRVGQPGHDVAREYLVGRLDEIGLEPFEGGSFELHYDLPMPTTKEVQRFTNLAAVIPGKDRSLKPILLGAHYDSVIDAPCADDNATSVAMNLAISEEYVKQPLKRDLIIALFDAEEPPHFLSRRMGSVRFHEDHCRDIDFAAVIVSDLIGHDFSLGDLHPRAGLVQKFLPRFGELVFVTGSESDGAFPPIVEGAAKRADGLRVVPTLHRYVGNVSDHYSFAAEGQPFLFLSCGQGRYYHHEKDDMGWLNLDKLARITSFVGDMIGKVDILPGGGAPDAEDPFDFELRMMRKAVGFPLPLALRYLGLRMPRTRRDMDNLIGGLINRGLEKRLGG